jgi:hypothetical protein
LVIMAPARRITIVATAESARQDDDGRARHILRASVEAPAPHRNETPAKPF